METGSGQAKPVARAKGTSKPKGKAVGIKSKTAKAATIRVRVAAGSLVEIGWLLLSNLKEAHSEARARVSAARANEIGVILTRVAMRNYCIIT